MLSIILSACVLAAVTLAVHTAGIAVLLRRLMRLHALPPTRAWPITRMLLRMIWWLVLLHLAEIAVWGIVLSVARMPARCRSGVLLFRSHLHDRWLRRRGAGEAVAAARTDRGLDGHPHVRLVHGLLLRCRELHPSIAQSRHVKATTMRTQQSGHSQWPAPQSSLPQNRRRRRWLASNECRTRHQFLKAAECALQSQRQCPSGVQMGLRPPHVLAGSSVSSNRRA